ncbi:MAG: hypothetical protein ACD_73C00046G0005 [uncultured bacterium]|nr:MAG: hypothetical protein ACD_73C00046G0005 [uncultured bacterium]
MNELFVGHQLVWQRLVSEINDNRVAGSYLFYGPPGIGKSLVAKAFTALLFCVSPQNGTPCRRCVSCEKVFSDNHVDFNIVMPLNDRKTISVDQCREVITNSSLAPLEAKYKVVLFPETTLLGESGWNALLKTLEEPQPGRIFILVAKDLSSVLPTIRSRCRKISFNSPSYEESIKFLGESEGAIQQALYLANGSIGMAKRILDEGFLSLLTQIQQAKSYQSVQGVVEFIIKNEVDLNLLFLVLLRSQLDVYIKDQAYGHLQKMDKIRQASRDIRGHVNKTFVLENLLYAS